ncbi:retron Se72 family effector protein [Methylomonas sp. DH-1]|uniref:retron Se72 family effector protein n=1 Tax=Methylomonas sp. (strain DH-1) TaxID=1727196 RepID=UPI0007C96812|nr:retron Se72 family effector protein [Methylomonas sp. DH-1]ANE56745.1 cold-shock protein [Methylomonas sp. DH-1]
MDDRHFGIIKTFDVFKGFGFIQRQQGKDVFFFYQEIEGDDKILAEGDKVSFRIEKKPKGWRAFNIRKEG